MKKLILILAVFAGVLTVTAQPPSLIVTEIHPDYLSVYLTAGDEPTVCGFDIFWSRGGVAPPCMASYDGGVGSQCDYYVLNPGEAVKLAVGGAYTEGGCEEATCDQSLSCGTTYHIKAVLHGWGTESNEVIATTAPCR